MRTAKTLRDANAWPGPASRAAVAELGSRVSAVLGEMSTEVLPS